MNKKICFKLFISLIISLVLCFLFYHDVRKNNSYTSSDRTKLSISQIDNGTLCKNNVVKSKNNDLNIFINNINLNIRDVRINISKANVGDPLIKIYYDIGNGFNETDSISTVGKPGINTLSLNENLPVRGLRVDIGEGKNQKFLIKALIINPSENNHLKLTAFFVIILFLFYGLLVSSFQMITWILFHLFSAISTYIAITNSLINSSSIQFYISLVLLFVSIGLVMLLLKLLDKDEEHEK